MIHPTAIVSPAAEIGENVTIGAYAVIEADVRIGDNSTIEPHCVIRNGARIGKNCTIGSFCVIAGDPQDLHFDKSRKTYVEIGDGTTVRELTTIHRATLDTTIIGRNCLLMASSHVGHDCQYGDNVIQGCFSAAAGFTKVGNNTFISGNVDLHQKIRVGSGAMLSGNSAFSLDVPPFVNAFERNNMAGLNLIGMNRRGFSRVSIASVKAAYMAVYAGGNPRANALKAIAAGMNSTPEASEFLEFFLPEERHYLKPVARR